MENQEQVEAFEELKKHFKSFFQHRKKIRALENFSATVKFRHKKILQLVKECLNEGFLGQTESQFLEYMLGQYEMSYLNWARRTKWVKDKMGIKTPRRAKPQPRPAVEQMLIDFDQKYMPGQYPVALIAMQPKQSSLRAG